MEVSGAGDSVQPQSLTGNSRSILWPSSSSSLYSRLHNVCRAFGTFRIVFARGVRELIRLKWPP